jgi:hypothetical protein
MKTIIAITALLATTGTALAGNYVNGYTRKDGTYVQPHYRSAPDNNRYNNYSTQGNVNPYTGQSGTASPYANPYGSYSQPRTNSYGVYGR